MDNKKELEELLIENECCVEAISSIIGCMGADVAAYLSVQAVVIIKDLITSERHNGTVEIGFGMSDLDNDMIFSHSVDVFAVIERPDGSKDRRMILAIPIVAGNEVDAVEKLKHIATRIGEVMAEDESCIKSMGMRTMKDGKVVEDVQLGKKVTPINKYFKSSGKMN